MKNRLFPVPKNEAGRLKALYQYDVLDSFTEKEYDFITTMASQICNTPVALISLLDEKKQWIKSSFGFPITETPREISFCNYTILDAENVNIVPDLRLDERYNKNPLVAGEPHAVFYAGAPLVTPEGFVLGSICVLDAKARMLDEGQQSALKALAKQIINTMELRKKNRILEDTKTALKKTNQHLREFVKLVSHDMKTPLANINMLSKCVQNNLKHNPDEQAAQYMHLIECSSVELIGFIDRMLKKSEESFSSLHSKKQVNTLSVLNRTIQFIAPPGDIKIDIEGDFPKLAIDEVSLQQVFQNLITNAIKYNNKPCGHIKICANQDHQNNYFHISDNGSGIKNADLGKIFRNQTLNKTDRYGNRGTGIGLAKVKNIVESFGGNLSVTSAVDIGTNFTICLPQQRAGMRLAI